MDKMKDLVADEWDRAYAEGYRKGYLTAMRWALQSFDALQTEQQTSEKQGGQSLKDLINLAEKPA
jgi:hypothetical protein